MGETAYKGLHRTLQDESNIYTVRCHGEDGDCMGCSSITLDDIHNENGDYQGNGASKPKTNSFNNVNYPSRKDYDDGTECVESPNNSKYNDVSGKRDQIYVRGINSERDKNRNDNKGNGGRNQSPNSKYEGECLSDITRVYCPNRSSQLPLGQLRRIGTLAGNAWTTKEEPKTPCRFVVPNLQSAQEKFPKRMSQVPKSEKHDESQEGCYNPKNPNMIVEIIANKKDRKRVAKYLNYDIESGDPSTCICYMEFIKKYGFDHIIIIGELYAGLLFLDCYGRVFEWDDSMTGVLRPLGDYLNEAPKVSQTHYCVIWDYESDGTVAEFEISKDDKLTFDIPATVIKKKKNSKKKKKKKLY